VHYHTLIKPKSHPSFVAALKEWAIVCKAAEEGKQVLLFRKGAYGIS